MPPEKPTISENALKALKSKQETRERSSGQVRDFAREVDGKIAAARDELKNLPKSFQDALQNNIVQYFLTSADRYDANRERGLSRAEFERYKADMLKKLEEIIRQYGAKETQKETEKGAQEKKEGLSRANEAAEKAAAVEIKETDFREENLKNPEGIQTELKKFAFQSDAVRKESANLSTVIGEFHKGLQKFEEGKRAWSVFLRGSPFVDDPETIAMKNRLMRLKDEVAVKLNALQAKKRIIAAYGEKLNGAGDALKKEKLDERDAKLKALGEQRKTIGEGRRKNEAAYSQLETAQGKLTEERDSLAQYREGLVQQTQEAEAKKVSAQLQGKALQEMGGRMERALETIHIALAGDLPEEERKTLEQKRLELLARRTGVELGLKQTQELQKGQEATATALGERKSLVETNTIKVDAYLATTVNPTLETLNGTLRALEMAKLKNGTEGEHIEATYAEMIAAIDDVDREVSDSVLQENLANAQVLAELTEQQKSLNTIDIESPNLWDATIGLTFGKIGEGWSLITKDGLCKGLDWLSRLVKKTTRDIPVLNVLAEVSANILLDLPSGVLEGAGELVNGIGTLVAHPIDTLKGISTLIPIYNGVNGKWFDFGGAENSWKEMGKAMVAYENFANGEVGKGIGKVGLNIILTATGIGAAAKGVKAARLAYVTTRASGASVARTSMMALSVGARLFSKEFGKRASDILPETARAANGILQAPRNLYAGMKMGKALRLSRQIERGLDELGKLSRDLDSATLNGRKISEIPELTGKSSETLAKLTGDDLVKLGITDARSIEDFLAFRGKVQAIEDLQLTLQATRIARAKLVAAGKGGEGLPTAAAPRQYQLGEKIKIRRSSGKIQEADIMGFDEGAEHIHVSWMEDGKQKSRSYNRAAIDELNPPRAARAEVPLEAGVYSKGETVKIRRSSGAEQEARVMGFDDQTGDVIVSWLEKDGRMGTRKYPPQELDELNRVKQAVEKAAAQTAETVTELQPYKTGEKIKIPGRDGVEVAGVDEITGEVTVMYKNAIFWKKEKFPRSVLDELNPYKKIKRPKRTSQAFSEGQEVYMERGNGVVERGWVMEKFNPNGTCNMRKGTMFREAQTADKIWSIDEIEKATEIQSALGSAAANFERMKFFLLREQPMLSLKDFGKMFREWPLKQKNVGNCYLISALNSVRASPHFEWIIRTSLKKVDGGWEVRIPLGDKSGRWIKIAPDDLKPQKNPNFGKINKHGEKDNREYLDPVDASEGFKVLEAAFIKYQTGGTLNRAAIEGGFGHQALLELMGTSFKKVKIDGSVGRHQPEVAGATRYQYGAAPKFSASRDPAVRRDLFEFLDDFHPRKQMATVNTPPSPKGHFEDFTIPGVDYKFAKGHAYSIVETIKPKVSLDGIGRVRVVNPWDTGKVITLTYEQFAEVFSQVSGAEIDYSVILARAESALKVAGK